MPDVSTPCREAALKLLERTRRTRRDLERRLKEKDFDAPEIERTLDRLAEVGLVDDVEYARAWLAGVAVPPTRSRARRSSWRRRASATRSSSRTSSGSGSTRCLRVAATTATSSAAHSK